jgi:hypothetical protein
MQQNDRAAIYVQCHSLLAGVTHCPAAKTGIKSLSYLYIYEYMTFRGDTCVGNATVESDNVFPTNLTNQLRGFSPRANYTDRATAACRQS